MFKFIKIAALSAVVGLTSLAAVPTAQADGIYFSIGQGKAGIWHGPRHHQRAVAQRACSPRDALRKAARYGINRAHVVRSDRHVVRVSGHKHRRPAGMTFARVPGCPVIR